ncbi:hypothetical protein F0562_019549 [Nyssa sinensis]|uniref:Protein kinase domain-containing protein n=1 Tax=Nyssa sinensis TaxID=561372 RepID=A0A5J5BSL0_9ASTE|nr:hypothetical protein F0562_019549 [Nyssa sinensis]
MFGVWSEDKNYLLGIRCCGDYYDQYDQIHKHTGIHCTSESLPNNLVNGSKQTCEPDAQFYIKISCGFGIQRDYVVTMEGGRMEVKRDLIIVLQPKHDSSRKQTGGILNGLKIVKLSNPNNNLAGPNPVSAAHTPTSRIPKLLLAFDSGNAIATGMIIILTLLNIIFYQLNLWRANPMGKNISKSSLENLCRCFSIGEMQLATKNFDDVLVLMRPKHINGKGRFGKVYRGLIVIDDETKTVAIKRLNAELKQGAHKFWAEIETLSKFRHIHLVSLIGYCKESQEMILVYEYMAHGTLADHIYYKTSSSRSINWEERLNICIGATRGLHYLHTSRGV